MSHGDWKAYCKVDDDWLNLNRCAFSSTGQYEAFIGVFVKLPGATSDRHLTFVADIPYWINTVYKETACKFNFILKWFFVCDATSCPLVAPGLYMGVQETSNKVIAPRKPSNEIRQEYHQVYESPVIPGNPDQTTWTDIHISIDDHWCVGLYKDANGKVAYEETISIDVPHMHISHSSQNYAPNATKNGSYVYMNPWVDLDYYGIPVLPEPAASVHNAYITGNMNLTQYALGKYAYMTLIVPASGKRDSEGIPITQSDYTKYMASATLAKETGITRSN
jgi:hypothetical protein